MTRKIISISFLYDGERVRIGVNKQGKFPLPKIRKKRTLTETLSYIHPHTAKEFVEHKRVKDGDPVLTLSDGTKMRVYQGGDSTGLLIEAISIIETHDDSFAARKRMLERLVAKKNNENKSKKQGRKSRVAESTMGFDYGYYYPDGDEDLD